MCVVEVVCGSMLLCVWCWLVVVVVVGSCAGRGGGCGYRIGRCMFL